MSSSGANPSRTSAFANRPPSHREMVLKNAWVAIAATTLPPDKLNKNVIEKESPVTINT